MSNASRAQDYLMQIISLGYGFDVPDIQNAITQTNYQSVEAAVEYLFRNQGNSNNNASTATQNTSNTQNNQNTGSAFGLLQSIFGANLPNTSATTNKPQVFKKKYHAYSPAYWNSTDGNRQKLECGDKMVLPASALTELSQMSVQFPILFNIKLFNIKYDTNILQKQSHCSVLEFTAPEGSIYLPIWMIDNLGLNPHGDSVVELTSINLPKGTHVQFQPHETKFTKLSNPRVILEKNLRSYSCLTVGDTIQIEFANYIYKLDVTKVKPAIDNDAYAPAAVTIIETDLKVDFMEPRDYQQHLQENQMTVDMIDRYIEQEEKRENPEFLWRITLTPDEKIALITGYVRICLNKYITNDIIEILIQYADYWAILEDIIKCKPYTKYHSGIFDFYGVELQLQFIPNGDPKDEKQNKIKPVSGPGVFIAQNITDVVQGKGDNSCILLSVRAMEQLGLFRGDSVFVKGKKECVAIALANEDTDDDKIRMNDVICGNVGCEYGDKVSIELVGLGKMGYASWIRICPFKHDIDVKHDSRPFGAREYGFGNAYRNITTDSISRQLFNDFVAPYFQDSYRPVRIGDVFTIRSNVNDHDFEVVDLNVTGNYKIEDDNIAIVAPETLIFIDEPIDKENKCHHIDQPSLCLCLKDWPTNIKDVNLEFEIQIKEINETLECTFLFSNDNLKFAQKQSKLLYTQKLKDYNQLTFGLKIKSIKLNDVKGNEVNIKEYIKQYEKQKQEKEVKEPSMDLQKQNDELQTNILLKNKEIEELNSKVNLLEEEVESLNYNRKCMFLSVERLSNRIAIIQEEKKELDIQNLDLKNEINELKLRNLNTNEYENWNSNELIHWIIGLESNKFAKYENILRTSFGEQNIDGSCLNEGIYEVDTNDIMLWGIRDFKDSKLLLKHIQLLVNHTNCN